MIFTCLLNVVIFVVLKLVNKSDLISDFLRPSFDTMDVVLCIFATESSLLTSTESESFLMSIVASRKLSRTLLLNDFLFLK